MRHEKPWANSVISFALTPGTDWIEDCFNKVTRMVLKRKVFDIYHELYRVGSIIEERLKDSGNKAHNIIPNGIFHPDHTFQKAAPDHDVKPPLSLRYMAIGAGVGVFGWSGNVMVPGVWSNAYLGGVLTDALLEPDGLLGENICDGCRICSNVCPVGFIHRKKKASVMIGGKEHAYNEKGSDYRCIICCGGYTGLSKIGKWSSWSTGSITLPEDDLKLPNLFARLRDDPDNTEVTRGLTYKSRGILDRRFEDTNPTCSHCLFVCRGPLEDRKRLMKLLFNSGVVEFDEHGMEIVKRSKNKF